MATTENLEELMSIVALTHSFQQVRRLTYATGEDRFENDAEHSFQLAFIAWYLIEKENLPLNKEKVLLYSMCHDIAEIYAGDVSFFRTEKENDEKIIQEKEALEKLRVEYTHFPALAKTIGTYESKSDEESKFVYALDKILPMMNIQLDGGRSWHHHNISFERLHDSKIKKVTVDPIVQKYFVLIVGALREAPHLFPNNK
ncbi:metal dependent phosphohydrolase [sediment metagenome]|uniref:5'-deoxynucleotidase n=1 Tax=sediment metagenome TaxID=749907 RepID=D9PLP5_9ZZZZ